MLHVTLQRLLRGVSPNREAIYWKHGIFTWDDLEKYLTSQKELFPDGPKQHQEYLSYILKAKSAFETKDTAYFANLLDRREYYRIPLSFPEKTIFLDIETTGLSRYYDIVTLVGWYYQDKYSVFIRGNDESPLISALADARVVITFNGSLFDLPFLREAFANLPIPPVHIDLRFLAKRVHLSGGQKAIEDKLGFKRPIYLVDVKGESAPVLWHQYRRGNLDALKLLIEYNYYDILGMKFIFDKVVKVISKHQAIPLHIYKNLPQFFNKKELTSIKKSQLNNFLKENDLPSFQGATGPVITFESLNITQPNPLKVVGIDLSGSEKRDSGWCLLTGAETTTRTIGSDKELISATLEASPHLVSIDSPLSLPRGRISVLDDDPGRHKFGIMRYCERLLKKRGINVYPALIPSMQKLTARGIRLATYFRSQGIPVIESYPGAAQDIMGIPRKRASLRMLCEGLGEFGIRGSFLHEQLTHDEIDAITSSVVGAFFWSGKFEALGSEVEEALIIPDLQIDTSDWCGRKVIGISGQIAAGKTTLARYFETKGYHYARYSMILTLMMEKLGKEITRPELQKFGNQVNQDIGQRELCRKLLETLPERGDIVIDGLRFPDDHAFWVETFGPAFQHIHIDASIELRRLRFQSREANQLLFEVAQAHPVEQQLPSLRRLAHVVLTNENSIQELYSKAEYLISNSLLRPICR
ncbi:MAG TPA: ribonuclease H-like domain-containing protein [Ginsengibacter sp.]|nr:ribonuclease H-like domain-containing protein [Ginsengibacter sp.]